jgi:hypothetical protein
VSPPARLRRELRCCVIVLAAALSLGAESPLVADSPLASGLSPEDHLALESIALEPVRWQADIFAVVLHGEVLVQLPAIWNDFQVAVQPAVTSFSDGERAALQDLMRYPELIETLVRVGPNDPEALERELAWYPESIREVATVAGQDFQPLMILLADHLRVAHDAFESLLSGLPTQTREAYHRLAGNPALIATLIEHLSVSERLAGSYRVDPVAARSQLTELRSQALEAQEQRKLDEERAREQERLRAEREEEKELERRQRRYERSLWYGSYPYWDSSCWYGDPFYGHGWRRYGWYSRHCWYPWHRYRRRWW